MYGDKTVLGLIPARAGSKGVPGKNLRHLAGRPLIAHTIAAGQASGVCDYLLVSTDGEAIGRAAREAGAAVPFLRPAALATDTAQVGDVVRHALDWCEQQGWRFDWVLLLQPTSPLRTGADIAAACELMAERRAKAVISVCVAEHHPWWSNTLPPDLSLAGFIPPAAAGKARQELPDFYRVNGAIYLGEWDFFKGADSWYSPGVYAYVMPGERSVDIDSEIDFALAEVLLAGQAPAAAASGGCRP